jgi:hypothetical protein
MENPPPQKTKIGFYIHQGHGINIIGGIYNLCGTAFCFRYCAGINVSGIYSERTEKQIFYLSNTSSITIQNSFLDIGSYPNQKLMCVEGSRCNNVQFIGNKILVKQNNGNNRIFTQNDTGTYNAFLRQVIFLGNQLGWKKGPSLADIDYYELPASDQRLCRLYTPLSGGLQTNSLDVTGGITVGFSEHTIAGTIRWNPIIKKLQVYNDSTWIDLH